MNYQSIIELNNLSNSISSPIYQIWSFFSGLNNFNLTIFICGKSSSSNFAWVSDNSSNFYFIHPSTLIRQLWDVSFVRSLHLLENERFSCMGRPKVKRFKNHPSSVFCITLSSMMRPTMLARIFFDGSLKAKASQWLSMNIDGYLDSSHCLCSVIWPSRKWVWKMRMHLTMHSAVARTCWRGEIVQ